MIDLDTYDIFRENGETLRELSKDDSGEKIQYMTETDRQAVSFDLVKRCYVNRLGLSEDAAASVDAVMEMANAIAMIEFKNGKVDNRNIKDKIRDSLLIFCDITNLNVAYTREHMDFFLVYHAGKNPLPNQLTKGMPPHSQSRAAIARHFMGKARQEYVLFGLERYKKLYFREVHTVTQEEFEHFYIEKWGK